MRAFENRPDTDVWDEPMYGHYLHQTGVPHPGAAEVIADQGINWRDIAKRCNSNSPNNKPVFYQKHMTMHLLPGMERDWLTGLNNCFLIRHPDQVVASYGAVRPNLTLDDIGFIQQAELFDYVADATKTIPIVIDSRDFLLRPQAMLRRFCELLGGAIDIESEPGKGSTVTIRLPDKIAFQAGSPADSGVRAKAS